MDVPDTLQIRRNDRLSKAGARIRKGLIDLAKQFPRLKKSSEWDRVLRPLEHAQDRLEVRLYHYMPKRMPDRTPQRDRFHVTLTIQPPPNARVAMKPLYPTLGLVGTIRITAGDPKLQAALNKLVSDALTPLAKLEQQAAPLATQPGV